MSTVNNDKIFIEIELEYSENDEKRIFTSIQSFLALYVYKYIKSPKTVNLCFINNTLQENKGKIQLNNKILCDELNEENIFSMDLINVDAIRDLRLPIYQKDGSMFIAGMCAVCRELVARNTNRFDLLGFKGSSLLAPSEASIWTRFCEVEVVKAIDNIFFKVSNQEIIEELPQEVSRFEKHMEQPVRTHNIYKLAREQALFKYQNCSKNSDKNDKLLINSKIPKEELEIEHRFAEGLSFSIADLLLYPAFNYIFEYCTGVEEQFPLTQKWMNEIKTCEPYCLELFNELRLPSISIKTITKLHILETDACSLYKSDPKRYKPKNRIFTEQSKVDAALKKLYENFSMEDFSSDCPNNFEDINIDWNTVEPTHEKSSALPQKRLERKRQQLENMANAISAIATPGDRIIDFCSGTGHLGILLSLKLPLCNIILVENKAKSLERAKQRTMELKLNNCHFYQCNIDYFVGKFDLGTSLHACGTATDIVLQQCRRSNAKFVCCPCCYGSLQPMPHISYPLSKRFRRVLNSESFMFIAHAADQSHELGVTNCKPETSLQGQLCMDIVDSDRKLCAEEAGYKVILTRLKPEQCTPKNRLLVGWYTNSCAS